MAKRNTTPPPPPAPRVPVKLDFAQVWSRTLKTVKRDPAERLENAKRDFAERFTTNPEYAITRYSEGVLKAQYHAELANEVSGHISYAIEKAGYTQEMFPRQTEKPLPEGLKPLGMETPTAELEVIAQAITAELRDLQARRMRRVAEKTAHASQHSCSLHQLADDIKTKAMAETVVNFMDLEWIVYEFEGVYTAR